MPYRDKPTVERWIEEFRALGNDMDTSVEVLEQDPTMAAETGLVMVTLRRADTVTYIQPVMRETPQWIVTFEAREYDIDLDVVGVAQLAADLAMLARLCAFLQDKTDAARAAAAG
ncbi:protein-L-isoaspartate carboxylmethyltransferase [Homoserinibacter sp. YIM 151385]|uniref:protein-L-isoaspartate carboxylmethyltransferase n=1 Tax=Homoserinibacter sp. YIM 151385 TaxID=2985506 RepID=UPI0022F142C5|nr:protein-L-isoaspartate carboxylmethyltransferase [Homoserinibacter sp. YIM 151385]WBU37453.1 protein-L-isoaspartate carboxylmethyltransferase [Homoserinibacter sp. YIM 151385]